MSLSNVDHRLQNKESVLLLFLKSVKNKFWTKRGLEKLGSIIRESRESKGLSLREASEIVSEKLDSSCPIQSVDHGTLARVEKGYGEPKFNTLVAIAASGLVVYKGKTLDIHDFINIASELQEDSDQMPDPDKMLSGINTRIADMCIREKIVIAMRFYGVTQRELEDRFLNRKSPATLSIERLREIQEKGDATEGEKQLIYIVLDSRGKLFSRDEWLGQCKANSGTTDDVLCSDKS